MYQYSNQMAKTRPRDFYEGKRHERYRKFEENENEEKLELPPINGVVPKSGDEVKQKKNVSKVNQEEGKAGNDVMGVLFKALLSTRTREQGVARPTHLPELQGSGRYSGSLRTSRSEPLDYNGSRKLVYAKRDSSDRNFAPNGPPIKEFATDKVVTFYQSVDKKSSKVRCVVSESRFYNVHELIEELSKVMTISNRNKYIHSTRNGNIIRGLYEFVDGGDYYFGRPNAHPGTNMLTTPELLDSDMEDELKKSSKMKPFYSSDDYNNGYLRGHRYMDGKKRKIIIVVNNEKHKVFDFVVDDGKHRNMQDLRQDISATLARNRYGYANVQRITTRNGDTVMSIADIFYSPDDYFNVTLSPKNSKYGPDDYRSYYRENAMDARRYLHKDARDRNMWREPFEVNIFGKNYVFDPPSIDYGDSLRKRFDGPPAQSLELEWIYGYNGKHCRNNLVILPSYEMVYFVAKVVVIYDYDAKRQRFYAEHNKEIRCIAQHPGSWVLASGQVSGGEEKKLSHIRIWDAKTLSTLNVLNFSGKASSVECLAFSRDDDGAKLVAIANSNEECKLQVWDWEDSALLSSSNSYDSIELACAFDPLDSATVISCGKSHVYFWNVTTKHATYEVGEFYDYQTPDFVTCLGFNENSELLTADSYGYIHRWLSDDRKTYSLVKTNHTGSIITMTVLPGDHVVTCGGADRMLCLINVEYEEPVISEIEISDEYGGIIAIAPFGDESEGDLQALRFLIGTSMNSILCGSMDSQFKCLVSGTSDQMTALSTHPVDNLFFAAGADSYAVLCSADDHNAQWVVKLDIVCSASAFHPNGKRIAVGGTDGRWMILNAFDGYRLAVFSSASSKITCISYSMDGTIVALGMESGAMYWYGCYDDNGIQYKYLHSAKIFADPVTSIDWSTNGPFVRFTTSQYDFEVWNMEKQGVEANQMILRDLQFEKETSTLNFQTAGIWNNPEKDVMFMAAQKNQRNTLLSVGSNNGALRLYNYPCEKVMAGYNEVSIHSSEVSCVSFLADDQSLLSCGLSDYTVAQWKVVQKESKKREPLPPYRRSSYYNDERMMAGQRYRDRVPENGLPPRPGGYSYPRRNLSKRESYFSQENLSKKD